MKVYRSLSGKQGIPELKTYSELTSETIRNEPYTTGVILRNFMHYEKGMQHYDNIMALLNTRKTEDSIIALAIINSIEE